MLDTAMPLSRSLERLPSAPSGPPFQDFLATLRLDSGWNTPAEEITSAVEIHAAHAPDIADLLGLSLLRRVGNWAAEGVPDEAPSHHWLDVFSDHLDVVRDLPGQDEIPSIMKDSYALGLLEALAQKVGLHAPPATVQLTGAQLARTLKGRSERAFQFVADLAGEALFLADMDSPKIAWAGLIAGGEALEWIRETYPWTNPPEDLASGVEASRRRILFTRRHAGEAEARAVTLLSCQLPTSGDTRFAAPTL